MITDTFFFPGATQPIVGVYFTALYRALASSRTRLLDHTQRRRATVGRTPLNEWSVRRRESQTHCLIKLLLQQTTRLRFL